MSACNISGSPVSYFSHVVVSSAFIAVSYFYHFLQTKRHGSLVLFCNSVPLPASHSFSVDVCKVILILVMLLRLG